MILTLQDLYYSCFLFLDNILEQNLKVLKIMRHINYAKYNRFLNRQVTAYNLFLIMLQPTESYKINTKSFSKKCTSSSKKISMINISLSKSLQNNISALEREYCYRNRKNKTKIFEIKKELEERRLELAIMKSEKTRTNSERSIPTLVFYSFNICTII